MNYYLNIASKALLLSAILYAAAIGGAILLKVLTH